MKNIRHAVVEGRFYPATREKILHQIREIESENRYPPPDLEPETILGGVLPHAGHIFSGHQTIPFFRLMKKSGSFPDTFVIVHPNHSGTGPPIAVDPADMWTNALGEVPVDKPFAAALDFPFNASAHSREHAAEVIVPFLQYYLSDRSFAFVPVSMKDQGYESAVAVAERIGSAARRTGRNCMVLASCDFSHFVEPWAGRKLDQLVLDEILKRNIRGVEQTVRSKHVSVCGYGPVMALMAHAESEAPGYNLAVLARGHSGEVFHSPEVVDYISLALYQ